MDQNYRPNSGDNSGDHCSHGCGAKIEPEKKIVLASQALIDQLKGRLRYGDELECGAMAGVSADVAMQRGYDASEACWIGTIDDRPVCVFGVVRWSTLSMMGTPWLLATDEFEEEGLAIVKLSKTYSNLMKKRFRLLQNFVDVRQEKSIKWLKWIGFTIEPAEPFGVLGMPFHRFWMKGDL